MDVEQDALRWKGQGGPKTLLEGHAGRSLLHDERANPRWPEPDNEKGVPPLLKDGVKLAGLDRRAGARSNDEVLAHRHVAEQGRLSEHDTPIADDFRAGGTTRRPHQEET
jgi:hypothetical protein